MNANDFDYDQFDEDAKLIRGVNSSNKRMRHVKSTQANPKFRMNDDYRPRVKTYRRPPRVEDSRTIEDMGF